MPRQISGEPGRRPFLAARVLAMLASLAAATSAIDAQERPDFTGRWELDTLSVATQGGGRGDASGKATGGGGGRGGGLGLGPAASSVAIRQDASWLTIVEHGEDPQLVIVLHLGGAERRNPLGLGRGEITHAQYSTQWEGSRLITTISRSLTNRGGSSGVTYREVRSLAADGSMVVELTMKGQPGGRTVVYRRAP